MASDNPIHALAEIALPDGLVSLVGTFEAELGRFIVLKNQIQPGIWRTKTSLDFIKKYCVLIGDVEDLIAAVAAENKIITDVVERGREADEREEQEDDMTSMAETASARLGETLDRIEKITKFISSKKFITSVANMVAEKMRNGDKSAGG